MNNQNQTFSNKAFRQNAINNLRDISSVLFGLGKRFWLAGGTLLGYCRNRDFIPHDTDTDIMVPIEDLSNDITSCLLRHGFKMTFLFGSPESGFEIAFDRNGVKTDIFFAYPYNEKHVKVGAWDQGRQWEFLYEKVIPRDIIWFGFKTNIPSDPERFVAQNYGSDWQTPKSKWDWRVDSHHILNPFGSGEEYLIEKMKEPYLNNWVRTDDEALQYFNEVVK